MGKCVHEYLETKNYMFCNKCFTTQKKSHNRTKCGVCDKAFHSKKSKQDHKYKVHGIE